MPDQHALLFANAAFYAAFVARDVHAMDGVWSKREHVTCIHPGWPVLIGREAVLESWQAILGNSGAPRITCHNASAYSLGSIGYVICYEGLQEGFLIATNIFVLEDGQWRMVHHQAGHAPAPTPLTEEIRSLQ